MPMCLALHHDDFLRRFYREGSPRVLGKLRVLYIKDLAGYLVPVAFRLNFYHHPIFNYAFIATIEKIKFMNLYQEDSSKVLTDEAMVFMVDEDMHIVEYSQNVLTFLNITKEKWKTVEEFSGQLMRLSNVVVNLDDMMISEFGPQKFPLEDH